MQRRVRWWRGSGRCRAKGRFGITPPGFFRPPAQRRGETHLVLIRRMHWTRSPARSTCSSAPIDGAATTA